MRSESDPENKQIVTVPAKRIDGLPFDEFQFEFRPSGAQKELRKAIDLLVRARNEWRDKYIEAEGERLRLKALLERFGHDADPA